jgi:hypothetical protein
MMGYSTLSDVFCHPHTILHRIRRILHPPTGGYLTPKLSISKYGDMDCTQFFTYIVRQNKLFVLYGRIKEGHEKYNQ